MICRDARALWSDSGELNVVSLRRHGRGAVL
jgi:hypothetical protein